jgi:hypothetical protein
LLRNEKTTRQGGFFEGDKSVNSLHLVTESEAGRTVTVKFKCSVAVVMAAIQVPSPCSNDVTALAVTNGGDLPRLTNWKSCVCHSQA